VVLRLIDFVRGIKAHRLLRLIDSACRRVRGPLSLSIVRGIKAHRLCVSLNCRLDSNKEEEKVHIAVFAISMSWSSSLPGADLINKLCLLLSFITLKPRVECIVHFLGR